VNILAPHKEQDGWVYVRTLAKAVRPWRHFAHAPAISGAPERAQGAPFGAAILYDEDRPESRRISSRRVEKAVENDDYLKRCTDEGLFVKFSPFGEVTVQGPLDEYVPHEAPTLHEAYYRYKAVPR